MLALAAVEAANRERAKTVPITARASSWAGMSCRTSPRAAASRSVSATKSRVRSTAACRTRDLLVGKISTGHREEEVLAGGLVTLVPQEKHTVEVLRDCAILVTVAMS